MPSDTGNIVSEVVQPIAAPVKRPDRTEYFRQWHQANKERRRIQALERRKRNREYYRNLFRERAIKYKDRIEAYNKRWKQEHREQCKAAYQKWYLKDKEHARRLHRESVERNYLKNRERILERNRKWFAAHPAVIKGHNTKRKRLLKESAGNLQVMSQWMVRMRQKKIVHCYYCGQAMNGRKIHFDHVVPISRGGPNSVENLCCSCQVCNNKKHMKLPSEWRRVGQITMNF